MPLTDEIQNDITFNKNNKRENGGHCSIHFNFIENSLVLRMEVEVALAHLIIPCNPHRPRQHRPIGHFPILEYPSIPIRFEI